MKTTIFFFCLSISFGLFSQSIAIEESESFDEPLSGKLKIVQLENLHTVLLHYTDDQGFAVKIFDRSRKLISKTEFHPFLNEKGKPSKYASFQRVLSIQNDVVCFFGELEDKKPVLYRIIIDGTTGKLRDKDKIGELSEFKRSYGYAVAFGGVPAPNFYISKDPNSGHYAVAALNSFESDRNKRIEIVHYSDQHNEINRAFYVSPNEEFKYLEYVDMLVMGSEKVVACATGHNEGDDKAILLATLAKGDLNISIKRTEFAKNMRLTKGLLRFNKQADLFALVAVKQVDANVFGGMFALFDPVDFSTVFQKEISLPDIDRKYKDVFGEKESFQGVPQYFSINDDGSYTIIFEQIKEVRTSNYVYSELGSMVVAVLDGTTKEIESYLIPKSHKMIGRYTPMYLVDRHSEPVFLANGDQYKSFDFVEGQTGRYLFFNDVVENLSSIERGKLTTIQGISASDAFICSMKGGTFSRELLLGEPDGRTHNFAMFAVSNYHKRSGTYTSVKLENDGGKRMRVIWMKL